MIIFNWTEVVLYSRKRDENRKHTVVKERIKRYRGAGREEKRKHLEEKRKHFVFCFPVGLQPVVPLCKRD